MTGFSSLPVTEQGVDQYDDASRWSGVSRILGPRWTHLPTLTIGLLGVQIFWSVEMSYASPYLLSLGLTKSNMAIVFVAGPLSGLIMQPLIGVLADNSTSRWGRRRPYMLGGSLLCMLAMLLLGFTRPVAAAFTGYDNVSNDLLTIWLAVLAIYIIDFSINAVQAVDRALLVDTLPSSVQASANAWAARMLGIGSVVGFFVGNINLPKYFPFLGSAQLEVLTVIVSIMLLAMHMVTAGCVRERVMLPGMGGTSGKDKRKTFLQEIRDIFTNIFTLPRIIRQICIIQFFAWIGWFPVLFYTTIYVGDLHKRSVPLPPIPPPPTFSADLDAEATRLGSRALFYAALLSLAANIVLPFFVAEAAGSSQGLGSGEVRVESPTVVGVRVGRGGANARAEGWWGRWRERLQVHLASLWAVSHLVFAVCMLGTFFTESVFGATVLMTITGFSWAITQWAPFSLLAEAILTEPASSGEDAGSIRLTDTRTRRVSTGMEVGDQSEREIFLGGDDEDEDGEGEEHRTSAAAIMGNSGAQLSRLDVSGDVDNDDREGVDTENRRGGLSSKAGIILGIHNVFIVIPQFLVTALSSIIFAIFDPEKSGLHGLHPGNTKPMNGTVLATVVANATESLVAFARDEVDGHGGEVWQRKGQSNSVVYIFRIGGLAAAIAFVLCWRLARELRHR